MSTFSPNIKALLRGEQIASHLDSVLREHGILFPSLRADPGLDDKPHVYAGGFTGENACKLLALLTYAGVKLAEDRQLAAVAESRSTAPGESA